MVIFNELVCFSCSLGNSSLGMVQAVEGFVVYHAAVSNRILNEHFNFKCGTMENHFIVEDNEKEVQTCQKLVEMFSKPGEWILDVNIPNGILLISYYSQTTRSVPISSSKLIWNFPNYFCNFEKPLCKSPEESCKSPYEICNVPKLIKCF